MALIHINFFSKSLGMCVAADVILPQYSARLNGGVMPDAPEKHPTLYLLHGMGDNHTAWVRYSSIERYAWEYGLAVVMPNGHLSSYSNMEHGGKYFDYMADELPEVMRSFFPLSDKREENFIAGLSMGGAGCLKIGLARPEKFGAIGCLSAGLNNQTPANAATAAWAKRRYMLYGDKDLTDTVEDTFASARKIIEQGKPVPRVYHSCGDQDFLLTNAHTTRDFFLSFEGNPFQYVYEEDPGAHTWGYWDEHIQHFLKYLGLKEAHGVI